MFINIGKEMCFGFITQCLRNLRKVITIVFINIEKGNESCRNMIWFDHMVLESLHKVIATAGGDKVCMHS